MPRDAALGRKLATSLSEMFSGKVDNVEFTYDAQVDLAEINEEEAWVRIHPANQEQLREGRGVWRYACELRLILISAAGAGDSDAWVDEWLDSWDLLIRSIFETEIDGKTPLEIRVEERYDSEHFNTSRRLVTTASLIYPNI